MQTTINITLQRILATAAGRQASDIHLTVGAKPMMKIADELVPLDEEEVLTKDFIEGAIDQILTKEEKAELLAKREVIVGYDFGEQARFRVDIFYQRGFPAIVFHYLPTRLPALSELGLPDSIKDLLQSKAGIILVGGEKGSGVTTTMMSMVNEINRQQKRHILIIDKPLEYILTNNKSLIEQKEVGKDVATWSEALDIKGEDVDVLVLGKVPSFKVLFNAFALAADGVLVIAPVSGSSVVDVLDNLVNAAADKQQFIRHLLSQQLKGVILQKMLPRLGGGVVLAFEVAILNQIMAAALRDGKISQINNVLSSSRENGIITLDRFLVDLVKNGQVDRETAIKAANNKDFLRRTLKF